MDDIKEEKILPSYSDKTEMAQDSRPESKIHEMTDEEKRSVTSFAFVSKTDFVCLVLFVCLIGHLLTKMSISRPI